MVAQKDEHRYAQRTVRTGVSSGQSRIASDGDMVVRNPAPDSSPPSVAAGTSHTFTLAYSARS
jgi:hypothetical protein